MIPLSDCKDRYVYKINGRNLSLAVFDGGNGFLGIRQKFGEEFLFMEFYSDGQNPFGTVIVLEEIEKIPDDLLVTTSTGTVDRTTGRQVHFNKPVHEGGKGWFYLDTGEPSSQIVPVCCGNKELFEYIKKLSLLHNENTI